jgi:GAF domain-containing protein
VIRHRGRRFETVGPTGDEVRRADRLQEALGEGPCVDAAVESRTVVSNDLVADRRWPRWGPQLAGLGLSSVLSSEIHADGRRVGALNVYGGPGHEFTREDMEVAAVLAQHVSVALKFAQQIEGLHLALDSRTVIGQAQGVLMERYDIDADRAFSVLRRFSQDRNIRLVEIARMVVGRTFDLTT